MEVEDSDTGSTISARTRGKKPRGSYAETTDAKYFRQLDRGELEVEEKVESLEETGRAHAKRTAGRLDCALAPVVQVTNARNRTQREQYALAKYGHAAPQGLQPRGCRARIFDRNVIDL